jgi:hypothetical protein
MVVIVSSLGNMGALSIPIVSTRRSILSHGAMCPTQIARGLSGPIDKGTTGIHANQSTNHRSTTKSYLGKQHSIIAIVSLNGRTKARRCKTVNGLRMPRSLGATLLLDKSVAKQRSAKTARDFGTNVEWVRKQYKDATAKAVGTTKIRRSTIVPRPPTKKIPGVT